MLPLAAAEMALTASEGLSLSAPSHYLVYRADRKSVTVAAAPVQFRLIDSLRCFWAAERYQPHPPAAEMPRPSSCVLISGGP